MTNGQPDSGHDLSEAEYESQSIDMYHRDHPACALCDTEACMAGAGCACEQTIGVATFETNASTGAEWKVFVHLGECMTEWTAHERSAKALAKTQQERLEALVQQIKGQLLAKVWPCKGLCHDGNCEEGMSAPKDWAEDRARNIVAGLIGELK